jgi:Flp pilus assembly protein TadD
MQPLTAAQAAQAARAFKLLGEQDAPAALVIARALAAGAARAPDAQHLLALCLTATGEHDAAADAFRSALRLAPGQPVILGNYARMLRRTGRHDEAIVTLTELTRIRPGNAENWVDLGLAQLDAGRPGEAVGSLRRAVGLDPRQARSWQALGNALRDAGELGEAEAAIRQGLAMDPQRGALWSNLAGVMRLRGRPEDAVVAYRRAAECEAPPPAVRDASIGALIDAGRIDEAFVEAERLTREHPDFVAGHHTLADLRWEYGPGPDSGEDPLQPFIAAAEAAPDHHDLQLGLISFLLEARRWNEACDRLAALRRAVDHPRLIALEANALEAMGHTDEAALRYAEAERSLGDRDAGFVNAYVRHLLRRGRADEAAARAERALAWAPDDQEIWAYLATAWRLTGDPREHWLAGYDRLIDLMPVDVPDGWSDMQSFLADLVAALEPLHRARTEPVRQSLRHGSQTPGRLFGRDDPRIAGLEQALTRTIERWIARLPQDPSHPFLRRARRSVSYAGSWSVKLWTSGRHANHFHNEGWMSSAFYVQLPPSVHQADSDAGCIQFGQPPEELGLGLPPRRVIRPIEGHLALFPSYMWHGTVPFDDPEPRITVAFDMVPRG